jgi:dTDP-4-dehydrorhamnose reductase
MPDVGEARTVTVAAKTLVLGASSFVGRHLMAALDPARTVGTYNRTPVAGARHFDSLTMNLRDIFDPGETIAQAVVLMGDTQPDNCIANPELSHAVNVTSTLAAIGDLAAMGARIVFTSTEFVFDGTRGAYGENDPANPILLYGKQKLAVERHLQDHVPDACILRLAKVYGTTPGDGTLFSGMLTQVRKQGDIRCAADQVFSPVYVGDVVASIIAAIERPLTGLFHVAGPDTDSRLGFLERVIAEAQKAGSLDVRAISCSINDFDLPERRPLNVSMTSEKIRRAADLSFMRVDDAVKCVCDRAYGTA